MVNAVKGEFLRKNRVIGSEEALFFILWMPNGEKKRSGALSLIAFPLSYVKMGEIAVYKAEVY